jgi:hypothetical protein
VWFGLKFLFSSSMNKFVRSRSVSRGTVFQHENTSHNGRLQDQIAS